MTIAGQDRLGQVRRDARGDDEQDGGRQRADDAGQLRLRAGLRRDGRPRRAGADRRTRGTGRRRRWRRPRASISWFWSTRSPALAARDRDRTLVSAIETTAMASPPATIAVRSSSDTAGTPNVGSPCGSGPTTGTPADVGQPEDADDRRAADRRDEDARDRRQPPTADDDDDDRGERRPRAPPGSVAPSATPSRNATPMHGHAVRRRPRTRTASGAG